MGNFLTIWVTISFSRRTLLHGVGVSQMKINGNKISKIKYNAVFSISYLSLDNHIFQYLGQKQQKYILCKKLWLEELFNYQLGPNVKTGKNCNDQCQPKSQLLPMVCHPCKTTEYY
jgi:hypothetical protein